MSLMKRLVLAFPILLLLLPFAFAETQIFSGRVITDTEKVIDGGAFKFAYEPTSNKVFVQTPATALIVENGKCESNGIFRICINKANFSHKNITTYVYYYEIDAAIYKLTGSLSTKSRVTNSVLLPHESAEFSITITNPTDFDITSIIYSQDLAPFSIGEVKGCTLDGSRIAWQGSLKPKYDKTCTAAILAEKEGTYALAGNLSYFNGFETEKKTTDSVVVTSLPRQLKVSRLIDKNIEVRQPFYINTSLQNINKENKIEVRIAAEIPGNMALLKDVAGFTKDNNVLKLNSVLEPGSKISYSLYLQSSSASAAPVKELFDYVIKDTHDVIENITVISPLEPKPVINFSSEYAELAPGQKFIVFAKIRNPSMVHELTSINARLTAPYNNEISESLSKLMPNESYAIISNTLTMPQNIDAGLEGENKTVTLDLSVEYKFYEAIKTVNASLRLKIKPANGTAGAAKGKTQMPQETKINKTMAEEATPAKPTQTQIQVKAKQKFLSAKILLFGALFFALLLIILITIKVMKSKAGKPKEEPLKELEENLPKE